MPYDMGGLRSRTCWCSYDKLIIGVGSVSATHGVRGLENCFQLKTIKDAQEIRRRILGSYLSTTFYGDLLSQWLGTDNFEAASAPNVAPEERNRLLSFVVCGGGPTGVSIINSKAESN